jgi:hypothetical protein
MKSAQGVGIIYCQNVCIWLIYVSRLEWFPAIEARDVGDATNFLSIRYRFRIKILSSIPCIPFLANAQWWNSALGSNPPSLSGTDNQFNVNPWKLFGGKGRHIPTVMCCAFYTVRRSDRGVWCNPQRDYASLSWNALWLFYYNFNNLACSVYKSYTHFVVTSNNLCMSSGRPVERFVTEYAIGMASYKMVA